MKEGKVFLVIGNNQILIEEKIEELSSKTRRLIFNRNFNEFFLEFQKNLNQSLLGERFDIVVKNIENIKNSDLKKLVLVLTNLRQNIFFVCQTQPSELLSLLRKNKIKFEIINIKVPKGRDLRNFLEEIFKKKKLNLPKPLVDFLINNYSSNIDLLLQDLNKIKALGDIKNIKDFGFFFTLLPNNFKILDLFLDKNWPEFIHNFKKFIFEDKSKDHFEVLRLLSLLSNSLIKIFLLKNNKKVEGHYFYIEKLKQRAQKLTIEEIKCLQNALAKTERRFKKFLINIKDIPEDIYFNYLLSQRY